MKVIIVIPARLKSTRLPRKVLLDLGGKPVIQRVYEACQKATLHHQIWIAADSNEVFDVCKAFTPNVIMTKEEHPSGTDRIAEVIETIACDMVINVQGDEPFFDAGIIDRLITALQQSDAVMASVCAPVQNNGELNNPNLVKVVTDVNSNAIYFSRYAIPFSRDAEVEETSAYKKHMGVYAYRASFLKKFITMPVSFLESTEKLEQLRAIENGYKIKMIEVKGIEKGIDTPEDLLLARKKIEQNGTI
ncbi:3-deoxy-manno-octulosonate cytidylyltransferase [Mucilaginibacter phyllosphaerae]|uniref:3-deoxy-manno-octulosonate cytidylyltransferase n=1 Tax=Mucilaginibacter phyllosphaerae TaxID=1812349 RepID=A0A4Y8AHI7_9SPHI|nr:3-deoxy-manno-octulosonate cytidylyltransferase [Mucilaginibacter phyllosphaerae]MBB3968620.1 3-deoxy-manno-octulosonate cytidylyltransferase (CMP-KDO synthetase) [Mucilaginibacter phyllosphaerae]TEW67742.1 3-deoxy-manno-octulosonate cytidylyltransferase [Mucilaginibacter phyllosphaerae]GGH14881.1 3-deoxy-manno-octulosonate cytidylyltransferase [Mucilaginibacter phyllosphaerae]